MEKTETIENEPVVRTKEIDLDTMCDILLHYYKLPVEERFKKTLPTIFDDFLLANKHRVNMPKKPWMPFSNDSD